MTLPEIARELKAKEKNLRKARAFVGFDGTVDKIVDAVDKRHGTGPAYAGIPSINAFGSRICAAAGRSTNIELYLKKEKVGGNAAIMAGALAAAGVRTTLVADLGERKIHPVFNPLRKKVALRTLGAPTETHALEFADGKIMLGYTRNHEAITFENVRRALGGIGSMRSLLRRQNLLSLVNWTMTPGMTELLKRLQREVLVRGSGQRFFFDLADPEKRPTCELREVLEVVGGFSAFGPVILGLNLKEAVQVAEVLGVKLVSEDVEDLQQSAEALRVRLCLHTVIIHPSEFAVCATPEGRFFAQGPFIEHPKIKTGAGDHFNAGFVAGIMMGASAEAALTLGVAYSGHYVSQGKTPNFDETIADIARGW